VLLGTATIASAQAPPDSDIWIAELTLGPNSVALGPAHNATDRPGYDNQPWFTPDGSGFVYSRGEGEVTDIFRYDLADGTSTRITDTPWGEYSPTPADDGTGNLFAVGGGGDPLVMGLWRYSAEGVPMNPMVESAPENTGYFGIFDDALMFAWINDGEGTLVHVDRTADTLTPFRDRTAPLPPKRIPGEAAMSFTEPNMVGQMWIMRLDPHTLEVTRIAPGVGDGYDFIWTPDGRILMADGEVIYALDPDGDEGWTEVARFPGVGEITRFAVSPGGTHLAFVATR